MMGRLCISLNQVLLSCALNLGIEKETSTEKQICALSETKQLFVIDLQLPCLPSLSLMVFLTAIFPTKLVCDSMPACQDARQALRVLQSACHTAEMSSVGWWL